MSDRFRKVLFWTHLCMGLAAGVFFLVMCATGILVAYRPQIEKLANHWGIESKPPAPGARQLPLAVLLQKVRENAGETPQSVTIYPGARQTVDVYLGRRAGTVYADAYTGAILGNPNPAVFGFFAQTMTWHTAMGIHGEGGVGSAMIDAANFASFFVVLIGLYLWLPRKWTWRHVRAVLLFRGGLSGKARDFNWHNVIGFWTLIPMAVMVWSGVAISYRWADRATIRAVSLLQPPQPARPALRAGGEDPDADPDPFSARIAGLDSLVERARARTQGWKSIGFEIPNFVTSPVTFTIDPTGYGLIKGGMASRLQLARSGEELAFRPPAPIRGRGVYRFAHTGELWGQWGQTIGMLGCLGGVFLVWTGVSLSLRRFAAWRRRTARAPLTSAT